MAFLKLSSSGKAVMFYADDGYVYMTSKLYMENLLSGRNQIGTLTRIGDFDKNNPKWKSYFEESEEQMLVREKIQGQSYNQGDAMHHKSSQERKNNKVLVDEEW